MSYDKKKKIKDAEEFGEHITTAIVEAIMVGLDRGEVELSVSDMFKDAVDVYAKQIEIRETPKHKAGQWN